MPVQVNYPGVYVQEVSSGVRTITGVSTSVALFVGRTPRGRMNSPTRLLSFSDYERAFGSEPGPSEMTTQVRQFFLNGGRQAFVMRIAGDPVAASSLVLENEAGEPVFEVVAREEGVAGDLVRMQVDYNTPRPESTFNLRLFRVRGGQIESDETFADLSMDPGDGRYLRTVVNQQSSLARIRIQPDDEDDGGPPLQDLAGFSPRAGISRSGLLIDDALTNAQRIALMNQLVNPAGDNPPNQLTISVDGGMFVPVMLPSLLVEDDLLDPWADAINAALTGAGVSASVTASFAAGPAGTVQIEIRSAPVGGVGTVVVRAAASRDASEVLQLGTLQGGAEVSGYAIRRPAPTGYFSRLDGGGLLVALDSFAAASTVDIGQLTLTDVHGVHAFSPLPDLAHMYVGTAFETNAQLVGSLRNVRQNLQSLADGIGALGFPAGEDWDASVEGLRLVLRPSFGGTSGDPGATLTSAGALDVGDTDQMMDGPANVVSYTLGTASPSSYVSSATPGADGSAPTLQDYRDAFQVVDREVDLFNLLLLPRDNEGDPDRADLWGPASVFCLQRRAFLLVDPRGGWANVNEVDAGIGPARQGLVNDHAAIYWPRLTVPSGDGTQRTIDPSGTIAGLMARTDANRGVWKAPAGLEASLRGVRGVEHAMSDPENGVINPLAVNAIRVFPNGIVSWGARTMGGFDNSGNDDYKYVPVRRLALFLEESLYRGLRFAVFEPNDEPLWGQLRLAAGAFMNNLFRQGAFQGSKASDAYFVKVDSETTTQNDINLGIVNVVVGFAPLKPAEFVVITLQQIAGQVQV